MIKKIYLYYLGDTYMISCFCAHPIGNMYGCSAVHNHVLFSELLVTNVSSDLSECSICTSIFTRKYISSNTFVTVAGQIFVRSTGCRASTFIPILKLCFE